MTHHQDPPPRRKTLSGRLAVAALLAVIVWAVWSLARGGAVAVLIDGDLPPETKIDLLRASFLSWGPAAPLIYVLLVTAEVVIAPFPGLLLYAPGGMIFGGLPDQ